MRTKSFFTKLTQWEHWPSYMYYLPVMPYYFYKSIRNRSFTFFLLTNPGIHFSGHGSESKYKTLDLIPENHKPVSALIPENTSFTTILEQVASKNINYPLIAKPDIGFRGLLVKKIDTQQDLETYFVKNGSIPIILQEFISYPNECGIFYYRYPKEEKGTISSITLKKFLNITGDGKSTIEQLVLADKRAFLYLKLLKNIHLDKMNEILPKGEYKVLSFIGNHNRGTQFLNGNHLISDKLVSVLDQLNKQIDGWYFGRLDLKYNTFESLENGKDFKVLEINGIMSEPTQIYDATHKDASYINCIKEIKNNWGIITKIALQNRELRNLEYPKLKDYIAELKFIKNHTKRISELSKRS